MANPSVPLRGLKLYLDSYLALFRELTVSVQALRETCAEKINRFEKVYARQDEVAKKGSPNVPNVEALAQISRDLDQLSQAIQELYAAKKYTSSLTLGWISVIRDFRHDLAESREAQSSLEGGFWEVRFAETSQFGVRGALEAL